MVDRQPIATAPLDGTFVLLFGGTTSEDFYYCPTEPPCKSRPVVACDVSDLPWLDPAGVEHVGAWVYDYWDGEWRSVYDGPTHWTPLDGEWKWPATEFDDETVVQPVEMSLDLSTMQPPVNIRVGRDEVIGPHDDVSVSPHDAILGISPTYAQMDFLTPRGLGRFIGGHIDRWEWSRIAVRALSINEALELYRDLKLTIRS